MRNRALEHATVLQVIQCELLRMATVPTFRICATQFQSMIETLRTVELELRHQSCESDDQ